MDLSKMIFRSKNLKNCIYFFLMFFFINNFLVEAHENKYLIKRMQEENKLEEFYSRNQINYSEHDSVDNQLKMFFGVDPENPGYSYYPDELIISDSDYLRDMYKLKLNDMTINKINYMIKR
tara:strand:+ start:2115 stop:2477 length:363 start_codon:yes stop_codon:yes gene_type:complete